MAAVGLVLFAVAAGVRLAEIDAYVTIDESRWVQRGSDFWALIGQGNNEDTFIIGHPGVTTMWTVLAGLGPDRARQFSFLEGRTDATRRDGYFEALIASRRPFAVIAGLGVAAVGLLGWRLFGAGPGLIGGGLLAFEPFLVAHARVAHLDSGVTTYTAISALSGLVYWTAGGRWPYLALSGVAAGLACLTKAPSVFVVGFVPLVALAGVAGHGWRDRRAWARLLVMLAAWGVLAGLVAVVLWPAFRVDPVGTLVKMAQFTERVGGGEHDNFFLGRVTDDPGPFFYPTALLLRLAPATLIGAVLTAVFWRRLDAPARRVVLWLAVYCVGFMAMMSIGPKKFDRYVLPLFPMLGLAAGLGLWAFVGAAGLRAAGPTGLPRSRPREDAAQRPGGLPLARARERGAGGEGTSPAGGEGRLPAGGEGRSRASRIALLVAVVVMIQAVTFATVHRYPLAFYNPLLGGSAVAEHVLLIGWGEGLDAVAAWLNQQPRPLGEPIVATSYHRVLQAQLVGSALPLERVRMADYVVPYVNTLQRGADQDVLAPYIASGTVEHAVQINGIEYARIYRGPHAPIGEAVGAQFGGRVTLLHQVTAPGSGDLRPGEEIGVLLRWDRPADRDERATVVLVATDGQAAAQDERALGADGPDERGLPGEIHRLTVPERTPAGSYRLIVRVAEGRGRPPLGVTAGPGAGTTDVLLRDMTVRRAP